MICTRTDELLISWISHTKIISSRLQFMKKHDQWLVSLTNLGQLKPYQMVFIWFIAKVIEISKRGLLGLLIEWNFNLNVMVSTLSFSQEVRHIYWTRGGKKATGAILIWNNDECGWRCCQGEELLLGMTSSRGKDRIRIFFFIPSGSDYLS